MKNAILTSIFLFLSSSAFASTYYKCGTKVIDQDGDLAVEGYHLELSSGSDHYQGPVDGSWFLRFEEDGNWLPTDKQITAKQIKEDGKDVIVVTMIKAQSATGPVGTRYKLIDMWSESPTLEQYTFGGFVGSLKLQTFECFSNID